jgi:DNA-binding NarL/FixJ family response regulator
MPVRVLLADDNDVLRGSLSEVLKSRAGWEVCAEVANGEQAVAKAKELKPDLIILDLAMPVVDGLKATREISKVLPSTPILIYTVHDVSWIQIEARKAGARKVISKPNADLLLRIAEELLRKESPAVLPVSDAAAPSPLVAGSSEPPSEA